MAGTTLEESRSGNLFRHNRSNRVGPFSTNAEGCEQVEIRPKRILRIQHINPQPRDPSFEKEMQMQKAYKSKGLHTARIAGGPLSMPKKNLARESTSLSKEKESTPLPHSVEMTVADESDIRKVSASGSKGQFTSPSNVVVDMNNIIPADKLKETISEFDVGTELQNIKEENSNNSVNNESNAQNNNRSTSHSQNPQAAKVENMEMDGVQTEDVVAPSVSDKMLSSLQCTSQKEEDAVKLTATRNGLDSSRSPSTVLFFIHGVGGSSDVWQAQLSYFAEQGYEIIAPDLIGHGMSCTPKNSKAYHFSEIAADMEEIFDKHCKKKNIIVGHSYGCSFAVVLARRHSRRVHKLVLISGGAPTPLAPQPGVFSLPTCMLSCVRPCLNCGFRRKAFHKKRRLMMDKNEAFSIPTYVLQHTMNGQDWPDGDVLYHQWLLCPTLLIYGAKDELVKLDEEYFMKDVLFRSQLEIIPDASHMVMIETPDEVNRLLLNFFTEDSTQTTKSDSSQPSAQPQPSQPSELQPPQSPQSPQSPLSSHPARPLSKQQDRPYSRLSIRSTKSHKAMPVHL